MDDKAVKSHTRFRRGIQAISGIIQNSWFRGYITGKIYKGPLKNFCLPGLNCYSCPGAVGACPIGALQAAVGGRKRFSFYVLGFLALVGVLFGRFACGWLCLFGLIQELLFSIPTPKLKIPEKLDKRLRLLKYFFLLVFVFLLTGIVRVENGTVSVPFFCKYVCPAGMLEGGIPLTAMNEELRSAVGWRYIWKGILLTFTIAMSVFIYRPFCKYVCPLGAFYGLFQKFSFLRLKVDEDKCVGCQACSRQCRMNVDVVHAPNSAECIRCGECVRACPKNALSFAMSDREKANSSESTLKFGSRRRYAAVTLFALAAAAIFIYFVNTSGGTPEAESERLSFTAKEIYGTGINSAELFGKAEVTMINVWASYCAPCAREMPELSQLNRELQEKGAQIVTVLWDSDTADTEEAETALSILESSKAELLCILHNDELETLLSDKIVGMPTSFLADSGGRIIAAPKTGADGIDSYRAWIGEYLN